MKRTIFKGMMCLLLLAVGATSVYAQQQQRKDTLVVARDGTGEYRNIQEAVEAAVEEKLKGGKPPKKAGDQGDDLAAQVEKIMMGY